MTTPASLSLESKLKALAVPQIDPTSPVHAYFLLDQIKKLNGALESRITCYLNPKNAAFCAKLIYAVPASQVINFLSPSQKAVLGFLGGILLWRCKKETVSKKGKTLLLHSFAIAFFTNILNTGSLYSKENLLNFSLHASFMGACFLAANKLEGKEKHLLEVKEKPPLQRKKMNKGKITGIHQRETEQS